VEGLLAAVDRGLHVQRPEAPVAAPPAADPGQVREPLVAGEIGGEAQADAVDLLVTGCQTAAGAIEIERRADRAVAARFDVISATNTSAAIQDERAFLRWVADHETPPPEAYRTIKLANLGLVEISDADAEVLESGPNQCAIG